LVERELDYSLVRATNAIRLEIKGIISTSVRIREVGACQSGIEREAESLEVN
jgi:hypothetical protein